MQRRMLLIDACVSINICATGQLAEIASSLSITFLMANEAASESRELREQVGDELVVTGINLTSYGTDNLRLTELREDEYQTYVELARLVDDGEAATIAIAMSRGVQLATDDRKARKVCAEFGLPDAAYTLDILHQYVDVAGLGESATRDLLLSVRRRASYRPRRSDPHYEWWRKWAGPT